MSDRTREAQDLLDNRLFKNIVNNIEKRLFDEWRESTSVDEREKLHLRIGSVNELMSEIRSNL